MIKKEHYFKNKKVAIYIKIATFILAGVVGFEPTHLVLETSMLPLTSYPYEMYLFIIAQKSEFDNSFIKKF